METRVGIGFDAHRLEEGRPLILGGEVVEHPLGLAGHSDGDALLHALTDALLGSVAAPDIGSMFPSGDAEWKGAESSIFVERAVVVVAERGFRVQQIDGVILAEEPQLSNYMDAIRSRLAALVGITESSVGLKATSTDRMGAIGRGEGVAAQVVVTVVRI